jgi:hypothetical protein
VAVDPEAIRGELSEALGSFGRIRIIAALAREPDQTFTIYAIRESSGMQHRGDIKSNLEKLVSIGWVIEHKSQFPKFQINMENQRVRLFVDFLQKSGFL